MNEEIERGVEDPIFGDPCEVFGDPCEVGPDANYGILIGGMAVYDEEHMALAYNTAADMLVEQALSSGDRSWEVAPPVLFLYRHAIELYLKRVVRPYERNHELKELVKQAIEIAEQKVGKCFPDWAQARLLEFANYDPRSTSFRYADGQQPLAQGEFWIHLNHLRRVMDALAKVLTDLTVETRRKTETP